MIQNFKRRRRRSVKNLSSQDQQKIKSFLQGQVMLWCKNRPNDFFSLNSFMGGSNRNWKGSPLQAIYDKNVKHGAKNPFMASGVDAGYLLQEVLLQMKDVFICRTNHRKEYKKV